MKRWLTILLLLSLLLTGCSAAKVIPWSEAEVMIQSQDEAGLTEELVGISREALISAWGEPDGSLFGMFGDVWAAADSFLYVYYTAENSDAVVQFVGIRPQN